MMDNNEKARRYESMLNKRREASKRYMKNKARLTVAVDPYTKAVFDAYAQKRHYTMSVAMKMISEQLAKSLTEGEIAAHMPKEKVTVPVYDTELRVDADGWAIWDEETPDEKAAAIQPKAKPMPIVPDYNEDDMQRELDEAHKRWPIDPPPAPLNNLDFLED